MITGASGGIGRAIALELARCGCDVAVGYNASPENAKAVCEAVRQLGRRSMSFQADVAQADECTRTVNEVQRDLGEIDILVNNAGVFLPSTLETLNLSVWQQTLDTNLTSAFVLSQAVLPGMRRRGWGRLIFLSSIAAQTGGVIGPHYAASKAGMIGLMHSYAALLAKEGITSNAVAPALIDTEMVRQNSRARPDLIPVGRFGTSEEVAEVVSLLLSNAFITGQTLNVNGGWYMS